MFNPSSSWQKHLDNYQKGPLSLFSTQFSYNDSFGSFNKLGPPRTCVIPNGPLSGVKRILPFSDFENFYPQNSTMVSGDYDSIVNQIYNNNKKLANYNFPHSYYQSGIYYFDGTSYQVGTQSGIGTYYPLLAGYPTDIPYRDMFYGDLNPQLSGGNFPMMRSMQHLKFALFLYQTKEMYEQGLYFPAYTGVKDDIEYPDKIAKKLFHHAISGTNDYLTGLMVNINRHMEINTSNYFSCNFDYRASVSPYADDKEFNIYDVKYNTYYNKLFPVFSGNVSQFDNPEPPFSGLKFPYDLPFLNVTHPNNSGNTIFYGSYLASYSGSGLYSPYTQNLIESGVVPEDIPPDYALPCYIYKRNKKRFNKDLEFEVIVYNFYCTVPPYHDMSGVPGYQNNLKSQPRNIGSNVENLATKNHNIVPLKLTVSFSGEPILEYVYKQHFEHENINTVKYGSVDLTGDYQFGNNTSRFSKVFSQTKCLVDGYMSVNLSVGSPEQMINIDDHGKKIRISNIEFLREEGYFTGHTILSYPWFLGKKEAYTTSNGVPQFNSSHSYNINNIYADKDGCYYYNDFTSCFYNPDLTRTLNPNADFYNTLISEPCGLEINLIIPSSVLYSKDAINLYPDGFLLSTNSCFNDNRTMDINFGTDINSDYTYLTYNNSIYNTTNSTYQGIKNHISAKYLYSWNKNLFENNNAIKVDDYIVIILFNPFRTYSITFLPFYHFTQCYHQPEVFRNFKNLYSSDYISPMIEWDSNEIFVYDESHLPNNFYQNLINGQKGSRDISPAGFPFMLVGKTILHNEDVTSIENVTNYKYSGLSKYRQMIMNKQYGTTLVAKFLIQNINRDEMVNTLYNVIPQPTAGNTIEELVDYVSQEEISYNLHSIYYPLINTKIFLKCSIFGKTVDTDDFRENFFGDKYYMTTSEAAIPNIFLTITRDDFFVENSEFYFMKFTELKDLKIYSKYYAHKYNHFFNDKPLIVRRNNFNYQSLDNSSASPYKQVLLNHDFFGQGMLFSFISSSNYGWNDWLELSHVKGEHPNLPSLIGTNNITYIDFSNCVIEIINPDN